MASQAERQRRKARKKARQRVRKQKKEARSGGRWGPAGSPRAPDWIAAAAAWPIYEAHIGRDWTNTTGLTQVLLARRGPGGQVTAAMFLLDLGCLGAKDGLVHHCPNAGAYRRIRRSLDDNLPMEACDPALAAKVVREGIRYAQELGFEPHPDAKAALPLLGEPGNCDVEVPLGGSEGKPFYMQGPHDDARYILDHLRRRLGPDGFHFVAEGGALGLERSALEDAWEAEDAEGEEDEGPEDEEAGRLLFAFAAPLLARGEREESPAPGELAGKLGLAAAVWNAVVEEQVRGTRAPFRRLRDGLLREAPADRGPLRLIIETLRDRKLTEFPDPILRFDDLRVSEGANGEVEVRLAVGRLISEP